MVDRVRLYPALPVGAHAVRARQVERERVKGAAQRLSRQAVARRVGLIKGEYSMGKLGLLSFSYRVTH